MLRLLAVLASLAGARASRVALVLHGETFRANAKQWSRSVGPAGYDSQKGASLSHLAFAAQPLVFDAGYDAVDVHGLTYRTGMEADLLRWYGPTANISFTAHPEGGAAHEQPGGTRALVASLVTPSSAYDAILLMRFDVFLKPAFVGAFLSADRSKILFPFMCGPEMGGCAVSVQKPPGSGMCPRVSDMFVWIPKAYFGYVAQDEFTFLNNHHTYQTIDRLVPGGVSASMSLLLLYEVVDSDPMKERNRIYRLSGRVEKNSWDEYQWRNQSADGSSSYVPSTIMSILTNEDGVEEVNHRPVPATCTRRVQIC